MGGVNLAFNYWSLVPKIATAVGSVSCTLLNWEMSWQLENVEKQWENVLLREMKRSDMCMGLRRLFLLK